MLFKNLWVPFSTETTDRAHFGANIHRQDVKCFALVHIMSGDLLELCAVELDHEQRA